MRKPDIVLVSPPTRAYSPVVPFPCIYLAAFLEEKGIPCQIVDLKGGVHDSIQKETEDATVAKVLEANAPYTGFTCLSAEYYCVMRMVAKIRASGYKGKIIAGGHHPTFYPEDFLYENTPFDFIVLGEGEVTLWELLHGLSTGKNPREIPGLGFYEDRQVITAPRSVMEDLSILPMPAYHHLDMNFYTQPRTSIIRYSIFSGVDIQTTRGCPCNCTYCGNPTLWQVHHYKKRFRYRPITQVLDELEYLKKEYRIDSFFVNDDSFTTSNDRVEEFCEGLRHRGLEHLVWGIQTRVNIFSEKTAGVISRSGCVQAEFGVESGSQRILDIMKKGITVAQVKNAFKICHKYKLRTFANFMINTPTETEEDLKATVKLAKEIKATHYGFFVTVPLLGTELYEEYVNPKLTKEEYGLYLGSSPYKQIVDKRFKLSQHNKNVSLLAMSLFLRFTFLPMYIDPFISLFKHFRLYRESAHRKRYLRAFTDIFFKRLIRHTKTLFGIFVKTIKGAFEKNRPSSKRGLKDVHVE